MLNSIIIFKSHNYQKNNTEEAACLEERNFIRIKKLLASGVCPLLNEASNSPKISSFFDFLCILALNLYIACSVVIAFWKIFVLDHDISDDHMLKFTMMNLNFRPKMHSVFCLSPFHLTMSWISHEGQILYWFQQK